MDDLRACLEHRPIQARAVDAWYRLRRWLRLHWLATWAASTVVLSLGAGLFVANRQRTTQAIYYSIANAAAGAEPRSS
jgi:hypothetical protein